jgi:hypothetical protein
MTINPHALVEEAIRKAQEQTRCHLEDASLALSPMLDGLYVF